jgi:hypothetical protein
VSTADRENLLCPGASGYESGQAGRTIEEQVMNWVTLAGKILEYAPAAISVVERIIGKGKGAEKKAAAAKEVLELVREALKNGEFEDYSGFDVSGRTMWAAVKDEVKFIERVAAINDAVVAMQNYLDEVQASLPPKSEDDEE